MMRAVSCAPCIGYLNETAYPWVLASPENMWPAEYWCCLTMLVVPVPRYQFAKLLHRWCTDTQWPAMLQQATEQTVVQTHANGNREKTRYHQQWSTHYHGEGRTGQLWRKVQTVVNSMHFVRVPANCKSATAPSRVSFDVCLSPFLK